MSVIAHLNELRHRFLASLAVFTVFFVTILVFYDPVIRLFTDQFSRIASDLGSTLFANTVTEGFIVQVQASAVVALIVSLPFHLINASRFVFPALQKKTRAIVTISLIASFILALAGAAIAYFRIIPFSITFLTNSRFIPESVGVLLNYHKSINYVLSFIFWTIISFQTPLILEVLLALDILSRKAVLRASRYVIVIIFIIAAVITPSVDPVSQCAVALPLIALFFIVILVARIFRFGEKRGTE